MKRLVVSIAGAMLLALLLGARGPAHGLAAALSNADAVAPVCEEASTAGATVQHAGLVVIFEGGRMETYCIEFTEEHIDGTELLERSGLEVVRSTGGIGAGICKIEGTGCNDPSDCFCQCRGAECAYWSYWTLHDGSWRYQQVGASLREVRDGDVDAWVWGNGRASPANDGNVCPSPTVTAPRAQPTPTPAPRATSGAPAIPGQPSVAPHVMTPAILSTQASDNTPGATTPATLRTATTNTTARATRTPRSEVSGAEDDDGSGGGAATGLIAFGAVAGALVIAIGGFAVWRRTFG